MDTGMANSGRSGIPTAECGMQGDKSGDQGDMPCVKPSSGGPMPFDISPTPTGTPAMAIKSVRDFEKFLRCSGFSRADAKRIAARGWNPTEDQLADLLRANLERLKGNG